MGFWKKLLGAGEIAGGLITGQPGLIATGAGTIANDVQSESAKKANQQQQQATNQAQTRLDTVYNTTAQSYAPYQQTGTGALSALNLGMGLMPLPSGQASAPGSVGALTDMSTRMFKGGPETTGGPLSGLGAQLMEQAARSPQAAQAQSASSYVRMVSPDGSQQQDVPIALVPRIQAAGGKVIGGVHG